MKLAPREAALAAAVLTAGIVCWHFGDAWKWGRGNESRGSGTSQTAGGTEAVVVERVSSSDGAVQRVDGGSPTRLLDEGKASEELLRSTLNKSLAYWAIYANRSDPQILEKLRARLTLEPEAALVLAMIGLREGGSIEERVDVLRQGAKAFPDNPALSICLAGAEADLGNKDAAIDGLLHFSQLEGDDLGTAERRKLMREYLGMLGTDPSILWFWSEKKESLANDLFCRAGSSLIRTLKDPAAQNLPQDDRVRLATSGIALAQRFNPYGDGMELQAAIGQVLEIQALKLLSPQTVLSNGETASARLVGLQERIASEQAQLDSVRPFIGESGPEIRSGFLQRQELEGTPAALKWIQGVMQAQNRR